MLTYDHMSKTLASSKWILEKKKQSLKNYSYVEVGIPIASGVTAGRNWIYTFESKFRDGNDSHLFFRFLTGLLSWICAIPFDVIKTYMQAELDPNKHRQMIFMFRNKRIVCGSKSQYFKHFDPHLWFFRQKYGWQVFYRGSWIILVRSLPANAATFIGSSYSEKY